MTPGRNKILKIPGTGSLTKISTIGTGNTFGARWWTDGKMDAPMMPDNPWFRRTPNNGETFWRDECEEVASEEPWGEESEYADVPFSEDAGEGDFIAELSSDGLSADKERYIRTRLWWMWNDPARNGDRNCQRPNAFNDNLHRLIKLLDHEEDNSRLMAAEGLRELGEHEQAAQLLDYEFPEDFQSSIDVIRNANDNRDAALYETS